MATKRIRKAAVIGGGVMGRGIAAHLANAGIPSVLLDIVPPNPGPDDDVDDPAFRNRFATGAIHKIKKSKPSLIYDRRDTDLITPGNVEDNLDWLADVDWVVEAVPEKMSIKQSTFSKIEKHVGPDAIISSNTSGLSIADMLEGRSDDFRERFLVTHFFNPVRYMKLLEVVPAEDTDPEVLETITRFGTNVLGKGIVYGKDTTNFVANRIGVHGMMAIMHTMAKYDMRVEDVDVIFGKPMGRPRSAVFRTADVVGLDTFVHVANNCYDSLTQDEERDIFQVPDFMDELVEKGWTGQKAGKGFYEKRDDGIYSLNLETLEYRPREKKEFDSTSNAKGSPAERIHAVVVEGEDDAAAFAREVTLRSLAYTARRLGEIADDVVNVDRAMRWGFNWDLGPFQVWDAIGIAWGRDQMKKHGFDVPDWVDEMIEKGHTSFYAWDGADRTYYDWREHNYRPVPADPKEISFDVLHRREKKKVLSNSGASLWDIGEGVALLEFHTKMNSIDPDIMQLMHDAVDEVEANWEGLVIGNGSTNFSVGANLLLVMMNAKSENWDDIEEMVEKFQQANQRMRYSSKPVVAAPAGMALGGGCEVCMGANAIQAAGETYMGLVEVGVGLVPGGGGTLQLLRHVFGMHAANEDIDPMHLIQGIFMTVGMAKVAKSAEEARNMGFLTASDGVTLNRSHVVHAARERVLGMARSGWRPPRPTKFRLPGRDGMATVDTMLYSMLHNNQISEYDRFVGNKLARILCGGDTTPNVLVEEQTLLDLEREAFLSLCGEEKTQARMQHMLMHNKPLRN